jgi:tRNA(fMet)-specific endonuclease VapC
VYLLERGNLEAHKIRARMAARSHDTIAVTVISYEEQTRGWFSHLSQTRTPEAQVRVYQKLQNHLAYFCAIQVVALDEPASRILQELQKARIRVGTMDLKIAAIALARKATLVTRNYADFENVPGLRLENWTL